MKEKKISITSGKRKRAIAKAIIKDGTGIIRINKMLLDNYNPKIARLKLREPLILAENAAEKVDIDIDVRGGGVNSQAEAARLALAKALVIHSKGDSLRDTFLEYDRNFLVADVRYKETHKPNRHGKARAKVAKSYR